MLLDKFEFIKPENLSGFEPKPGAVKIIKKEYFRYVNLGSIIGDAPKCMLALYKYDKNSGVRRKNSNTWKNYIAKSASKWYPNESITEHLLNELGRSLGLSMANSCLRRINEQIWFLSEYFLDNEQTLYHGADLYAQYLNNDSQFVKEVQDNNKIEDQDFFSVQLVEEIFYTYFKKNATLLFYEFIKMLIFDGLIGNNDRHAYNWGVVTSIKTGSYIKFAPIYDTARGLYWNTSEENVRKILNLTDNKGNNSKIKKYVVNSRPKIGWESEKTVSHLELLKLIYQNETGISKENFVDLVSESNLYKCLDVINKDFNRLITLERRMLITKCLELRFRMINDLIK